MNQLAESLGSPRALARASTAPPQASGLVPPCPREDDAEAAESEVLGTARRRWRDGDAPAAIDTLSHAVEQRPGFAAAQLHLQDYLFLHHSKDEFLVRAGRSLQGLPADDPLRGILRARSLRLVDRIAEARCALDEIRPSLQDCPLLLLEDAATLREAGRMPEAIEACRRALELAPESARTHEEMARLSLSGGRKDAQRAEEAARRALELQPESSSAAALLASARYHGGDRKTALSDLKAITTAHPHDVEAWIQYLLLFPFDVRSPTDLLSHPTGHVLEAWELNPAFLFVGNVKLGLPGGLTMGTNTFRWILKEPNALAKLRFAREGRYLPAAAIQARFVGNEEIEDSGSHGSELELFAAISKKVSQRVSLHLGGGPIVQDRDSPFILKDGTGVIFRDREAFAALDVEVHPHVKLLLEPALVGFEGEPWEDWQAAGGVLFDVLLMRCKVGVEYQSWDDSHWYPNLGMWFGR